jgi:hypothetical protein
MSYTYASFVTALANDMAVGETDADFVATLPSIIDYAEQRIYRELDLLAASVTSAGTLTANSRSFTLPTTNGHVLVVDFINVIDSSSDVHVATPASRDMIETLYPRNTAASATDIPKYFARISDTVVLLGPSPGAAWSCDVVHTMRPTALSGSNTTTFLSNYLSDLFFCAAMVRAAGFMRNYGAQADDPRMAVSWEQQYQTLLTSAKEEEYRKQYIMMMSTPGRG